MIGLHVIKVPVKNPFANTENMCNMKNIFGDVL